MKLTFLGTGTSQGVPVIGCNCPICQSADSRDKRLRTAALFTIGNTQIVIDIGPDFRQQMLAAKLQNVDAILLTHEHNDHIIGMDDVRPFNFSSGHNMPVYATERVQEEVQKRFSYIFEANPYPGAPRLELHTINIDQPFFINQIKVTPIPVMHGKMPVLGFRIGNCTYITDAKEIDAKARELIKGSEVLVLNALHHNAHHSHFNLEEALEMVNEFQPGQAYFTHISHRMGFIDEVNATLPTNVQLGYDGLVVELDDPED